MYASLLPELAIADRRQKREIRHLEQELPKWQVLVDNVTGVSPQDFDNQTLAVLRGRLVRYLMRSREVSVGPTDFAFILIIPTKIK
jgi:microspherule protein 1